VHGSSNGAYESSIEENMLSTIVDSKFRMMAGLARAGWIEDSRVVLASRQDFKDPNVTAHEEDLFPVCCALGRSPSVLDDGHLFWLDLPLSSSVYEGRLTDNEMWSDKRIDVLSEPAHGSLSN